MTGRFPLNSGRFCIIIVTSGRFLSQLNLPGSTLAGSFLICQVLQNLPDYLNLVETARTKSSLFGSLRGSCHFEWKKFVTLWICSALLGDHKKVITVSACLRTQIWVKWDSNESESIEWVNFVEKFGPWSASNHRQSWLDSPFARPLETPDQSKAETNRRNSILLLWFSKLAVRKTFS